MDSRGRLLKTPPTVFDTTRRVTVKHVATDSRKTRKEIEVPLEATVEIVLDGADRWRVMATPAMLPELAVGLLFAEQRIASCEDVASLDVAHDRPVIHVERTDACRRRMGDAVSEQAPLGEAKRGSLTSIATSGERSHQQGEEVIPVLEKTLVVRPEAVGRAMEELHARQELKRRTRGTHAMGLFFEDGELAALAEDVGRHNALDKVIGFCMLSGIPTQGLGAVYSSRVSLEMAMKAARAGIECIASISAPTSLALEKAESLGLTVASFVRDGEMTIFTHGDRFV